MDLPTGVNLALSILSVILVVVSVSVAVITVRQNNKMIEASTRPYIVVTSKMTNFGSPVYYLVLKNYGQSGAHIDAWSVDFDLAKCSLGEGRVPFSNIEGSFLAPSQSVVCAVDYQKLKALDRGLLVFEITYSSESKSYKEKCRVNIAAYADLVHARSSSSSGDLKNISYALQDLVEKTL